MRKTWIWIGGWGIQPQRFQRAAEKALPGYSHHVLPPSPNAVARALARQPDRIGGYSLGSLLLLDGIDAISEAMAPVVLAPFTAFCSEHALGGTTQTAALASIRARLETAPHKALKLFYRLAHLPDEPTDALPYALDALIWGLKVLQNNIVDSTRTHKALAVYGSQDALINYPQSPWANAPQTLVIDSSHAYEPLLQALAHSQ